MRAFESQKGFLHHSRRATFGKRLRRIDALYGWLFDHNWKHYSVSLTKCIPAVRLYKYLEKVFDLQDLSFIGVTQPIPKVLLLWGRRVPRSDRVSNIRLGKLKFKLALSTGLLRNARELLLFYVISVNGQADPRRSGCNEPPLHFDLKVKNRLIALWVVANQTQLYGFTPVKLVVRQVNIWNAFVRH